MSYQQPQYRPGQSNGTGENYPNEYYGYAAQGYSSASGYPPSYMPEDPYDDEADDTKQSKGSAALIIALAVVLVLLLVVLGVVIKKVYFSEDSSTTNALKQEETTEKISEKKSTKSKDDDPLDGAGGNTYQDSRTRGDKKKNDLHSSDRGLTGSRNQDVDTTPDYNAPIDALTGRSLQIPGKNIGCELKGGVWGCTMEMTGPEDCGNGKVSYVIDHNGLVGRDCNMKFLGQPGDYVPTLLPGDYWQNGSFACKIISNTSVQCWNTDNGEGFLLATNSYTEREGEKRPGN